MLHFCRWQYCFSESGTVGSKSCRIVLNNALWQPLGRSRSPKVTNFGTDRWPVCDFVSENDTNLYHTRVSRTVSESWRRVGSNYRFAKFGFTKLENITLLCGAHCTTDFDMLNRLDVNHQCDRQMDGRTDGR